MNSILNFFYSPMVMMSVLLHGLFLMIPLPAEPPAAPEIVESPEKEEAVKLSSVSSLKIAPKPAASPAVAKLAKPITKPLVRPVRPLIRPASAARPLPTPVQPLPSVQPAPAAPVAAAPAAAPAPSPAEPAVPLSQGQLQSSAAGAGQASAAQFYSSFPDPTAFFTAESIQQAEATLTTDPVPVEGITNMTRLELIGVDQAKTEKLPEIYPGATFTQIGTYGGGDVYEVRQANSIGYVVLVKEASLSKATYIVEWNRDPNSAQATAPQ